jgi:cell division protein FtsB
MIFYENINWWGGRSCIGSHWHVHMVETLLAGAIPVMLLLGGGLALYLGFDELKDSWKKEDTTVDTSVSTDETEEYKKEIDDLKKEIETLKSEKEKE